MIHDLNSASKQAKTNYQFVKQSDKENNGMSLRMMMKAKSAVKLLVRILSIP